MLLDLDPNVVKPGWTPLLITVGLAVVILLLFFSMRRQFRRIDVSQSQALADGADTSPPDARLAAAEPDATATPADSARGTRPPDPPS